MRLLGYLALAFPTLVAAQSSDHAAGTITPEDFMRRLAVIAADSMMGRGNPSPGLERTADYVTAEFRRAGLRPGGEHGEYRQLFQLVRWTVDSSQSWVELRGPGGRGLARLGGEARYVDGRFPPAEVEASVLLLAGDLAPGSDVRGRVLLLVLDYSQPLPPNLGDDIGRLSRAGSAAILLLSNRDSATFAARLRTAAVPRLSRSSALDTLREAPILELHERTLGPVLAAAGVAADQIRQSGKPVRRLVPGLSARMKLVRREERIQLPNVIGILPGRDSMLRHQFVVFSAHIDHIGITPGLADSINNGADDNASGVAGLLELAEAFGQPGARPRRSLLFLAPSAEEPGLLGSAHFTEHPTVPLDSIVADINMDLIGRNWTDSVIAVGIERSDLGATLQKVVAAHRDLRMTPIRDRWPEERIFYRSDHYNFARRGVPILFFTSGTHADYHRPTDTADRIDGEKASRLVRLLFHLGTTVANRTERPR